MERLLANLIIVLSAMVLAMGAALARLIRRPRLETRPPSTWSPGSKAIALCVLAGAVMVTLALAYSLVTSGTIHPHSHPLIPSNLTQQEDR